MGRTGIPQSLSPPRRTWPTRSGGFSSVVRKVTASPGPECALIVRRSWCEGTSYTCTFPPAVPASNCAPVSERDRDVTGSLNGRLDKVELCGCWGDSEVKGLRTQQTKGVACSRSSHLLRWIIHRSPLRLQLPRPRVHESYRSVYEKGSLGEWNRLPKPRRRSAR